MILTEFDASKTAIINPWDIVTYQENMPRVAVTCFSHVTFDRLINELETTIVAESRSANMVIPIYKATYRGKEIALFMSDIGAAGCVSLLEEVYAMGVEKIVMFGTCGVLEAGIGDCSIIIPNRAVRDEGTSYHYAAASDEIDVNPKYQDTFIDLLESCHCSYTLGKVWTTDGVYRETKGKMQRRKDSGCICVDMECSAVAALAQFREKEVFQFFYAADNLDAEEWEERSLSNEANVLEKDRIAMLAMELAVRMGGQS